MPTFQFGKTGLVYLFNGLAFQGYHKAFDPTMKVAILDSTTFGTSQHKTAQPGMRDDTLKATAFFVNTTPDLLDDTLKAALRANTACLAAYPTTAGVAAAGDPCDLWIAKGLTYGRKITPTALIEVDTDHILQDGLHAGYVAAPLAAHTGFWTTTGYDRGASADFTNSLTYALQVQLTAYTSSLGIVMEHSTNNSTWTTAYSFAAMTAVGGTEQRVTLVLKRYVRLNGSGAGTVLAAFAQVL